MELDQANRHPTRKSDLYRAVSASAGDEAVGSLLIACLEGLRRYLLNGCRLYAERASLLLARAEADGLGDGALQTLCGQMSERPQRGGLPGHDADATARGAAHV